MTRAEVSNVAGMEDLRRILARIDGRGYKAYKGIQGDYRFGDFTLCLDYVQGDPFASPSKVRARVPMRAANLPPDLFGNPIRRVALEDFLARQVRCVIRRTVHGGCGRGKSGLIAIDADGQEVLERTAVVVTPEWVEARLHVGLPAAGREYVVTCRDAVKIRAEDGRRVERVDISPFISSLPYGRSTTAFSSDDASGSTSQAANIVEAVELSAAPGQLRPPP